jgi:hypothetical protein
LHQFAREKRELAKLFHSDNIPAHTASAGVGNRKKWPGRQGKNREILDPDTGIALSVTGKTRILNQPPMLGGKDLVRPMKKPHCGATANCAVRLSGLEKRRSLILLFPFGFVC